MNCNLVCVSITPSGNGFSFPNFFAILYKTNLLPMLLLIEAVFEKLILSVMLMMVWHRYADTPLAFIQAQLMYPKTSPVC